MKEIEKELKSIQKRVDDKMGIKESDTGLAPANLWDTTADKERQGEHPLQVARCQTIIRAREWSVYDTVLMQQRKPPKASRRSTPKTEQVRATPRAIAT